MKFADRLVANIVLTALAVLTIVGLGGLAVGWFCHMARFGWLLAERMMGG